MKSGMTTLDATSTSAVEEERRGEEITEACWAPTLTFMNPTINPLVLENLEERY
jgi:hypothetical protein